jgi:hypothetical protein
MSSARLLKRVQGSAKGHTLPNARPCQVPAGIDVSIRSQEGGGGSSHGLRMGGAHPPTVGFTEVITCLRRCWVEQDWSSPNQSNAYRHVQYPFLCSPLSSVCFGALRLFNI